MAGAAVQHGEAIPQFADLGDSRRWGVLCASRAPTSNPDDRTSQTCFIVGAELGVSMKKFAIFAAMSVGLLSASAQPASAQACVGGIFIAAIYASVTENRELSMKEAATCGLLYGADRDKAVKGPPKKPVAKAAPKTAPKTAAKAQ